MDVYVMLLTNDGIMWSFQAIADNPQALMDAETSGEWRKTGEGEWKTFWLRDGREVEMFCIRKITVSNTATDWDGDNA